MVTVALLTLGVYINCFVFIGIFNNCPWPSFSTPHINRAQKFYGCKLNTLE
ncbi:hypothetical protein SCHPADRAFT_495406 [Schizopora paradoxa]|uniref:Uncharacterized protein n=1 Tax=Schizopora paradoxa TaxID=27342 RepID=A0A0H2S1T7_9AGAM|nr:hypothetical protein SCHPADRAFT_495406 [Schizopora paradoxa]